MRPLDTLSGDADRLEQVFNNLLKNAIKNTPKGGHIEVEGTQTENMIEVVISDSGIAADKLPHVFERFYRASDTTPDFGLRLAIALEIVRAHGGDIDVSSDGKSGSRFTVSLPVEAERKA